MCVVCGLLFSELLCGVCFLRIVVHCWLFVVRRSLFVGCCLLLVGHYMLIVVLWCVDCCPHLFVIVVVVAGQLV